MKWLKNLFLNKKIDTKTPTIPPIEEISDFLYDKSLSFAENLKVVKVIYSKDKTKRFIILKSFNGFYKYSYEEICIYDAEEWNYICNTDGAYPAYWQTNDRAFAYSFFGTEDEVMNALMTELEYREYFL